MFSKCALAVLGSINMVHRSMKRLAWYLSWKKEKRKSLTIYSPQRPSLNRFNVYKILRLLKFHTCRQEDVLSVLLGPEISSKNETKFGRFSLRNPYIVYLSTRDSLYNVVHYLTYWKKKGLQWKKNKRTKVGRIIFMRLSFAHLSTEADH